MGSENSFAKDYSIAISLFLVKCWILTHLQEPKDPANITVQETKNHSLVEPVMKVHKKTLASL